MPRRLLVTLALPVLALAALGARKPDDPKHENHFKATSTPTSDVFSLSLIDAEAQAEFVQVNTKVTNNTGDKLVVIKKDQASFVLPQGSFPVKAGGLFGGPLIIPPNETRSHTFKVDGESGFHVDAVTLKLGGIYTGSNSGTTLKVPDFQLPPKANDFAVGPFSCKLLDTKQTTDLTTARFACKYNGTGLGIVEPKRVGVKEPGGQEYANAARKSPRDVLLPGDTSKFSVEFQIPKSVVDMQFATLQVLWRDAFAETALTPVAVADWTFALDPDATAAANK
jgi:hypothetical protein